MRYRLICPDLLFRNPRCRWNARAGPAIDPRIAPGVVDFCHNWKTLGAHASWTASALNTRHTNGSAGTSSGNSTRSRIFSCRFKTTLLTSWPHSERSSILTSQGLLTLKWAGWGPPKRRDADAAKRRGARRLSPTVTHWKTTWTKRRKQSGR